jgi:hypothetical protein
MCTNEPLTATKEGWKKFKKSLGKLPKYAGGGNHPLSNPRVKKMS